jgi:SAM-dependent methyltransferase
VLADVETLSLGRRFDAVVFGSQLVNVPEPERRRRLLATCARHVAPDGVVLIEWLPPDWEPVEDAVERGGVRIALREARRAGKLVTATMEYAFDGRLLRHPFASYVLDDAELAAALAEVGLVLDGVLDERGAWVRAAPAPPGRASPPARAVRGSQEC